MADPERFNADPDPTFHVDADPNLFRVSITFSLKSLTPVSKILQYLSSVIFTVQECRRRGEG